jgi:hypothetical protein
MKSAQRKTAFVSIFSETIGEVEVEHVGAKPYTTREGR